MKQDMDRTRAARLTDLHVRLEAGEFAGAFNMDSDPTAGQLGMEYREEFRLYGYTTRVDRDPAVDFDGFLEELWVLVASRFQLVLEEGNGWAGMPNAWRQSSDTPLRDGVTSRSKAVAHRRVLHAGGSGRQRRSDVADSTDD